MSVEATDRWHGISALALLCGAIGMLFGSPAVLLASVAGLVFAAYARIETVPRVELDVDRTVSDVDPASGDSVEVEVTVSNTGPFVGDLRLVDGVPPGLEVTDGSPRCGTALERGDRVSFSYDVLARRGVHRFEPVTVVARNLSGTVERTVRIDRESVLTCTPSLVATDDVPLRALTTRNVGRVETDSGGDGLEFHATREYRSGDSLSRVDWNRYARTGSLSTVEFREERAASVVLLVDTRESAFVAPGSGDVHAVERGLDAAGQIGAGLLDAGDQVGLAALGPEACYVSPRGGRDQRARLREELATHEAFAPTPSSSRFYPRVWLRQFRRRIPNATQVVAFSPLCDDQAVALLRRLRAHEYAITVISPDVTTDGSASERLGRELRTIRLERARSAGLRVVDWEVDQPLGVAVTHAARRWS
jgi:uncharacterized protein (DUF58 family)